MAGELLWSKKPSWSLKKVHKLEQLWLKRLETELASGRDPKTMNLDMHDLIELSWMGFFQLQESIQQAVLSNVTSGNDESFWLALHMYGNKEFAHLAAIAKYGQQIMACTPMLFRSVEMNADELKKTIENASMLNALKACGNHLDLSCIRIKYVTLLAVIGFMLQSSERQRAIVFEQDVSFPSAEWWHLMYQLITNGFYHVMNTYQAKIDAKLFKENEKKAIQEAKIAAKRAEQEAEQERIKLKEQDDERQRIETKNIMQRKKDILNRLHIPNYKTKEFQEFIRKIVFRELKDDDQYVVYPFYMKLPEGQLPGEGVNAVATNMWDVKRMLEDSASENARDGCQSYLPYLQPHQAIVNAMLQLRALGLVNTPGLLAMHSTGAGKTLLTLCALLAFWNIDHIPENVKGYTDGEKFHDRIIEKPIPIFIVSVKSNQQDNGLAKLAQYGMAFFRDFEDRTVPKGSNGRFPFQVENDPSYNTIFESMKTAKHQLFMETLFEIDGNEAMLVAGKDLALNENDREDLYQAFVRRNDKRTIKFKKHVYKIHNDAVSFAIDITAEPAFQDIVASHIAKRLRRGFEGAAKGKNEFDIIKKRGRDLYTFETLGNDLDEHLYRSSSNGLMRDALFVVDEAHYINLPYHKGEKLARAYQLLKNLLQNGRDHKTTWCLAMTATPGETKEQVIELLRAVATKNALGNISDTKFVDKIRGLVSYAQLYGDYSHFARMDPKVFCFPLSTNSLYGRLYQRSLCKLPYFHENIKESAEICQRDKPNVSLTNEFTYDSKQKGQYYRYLKARSNFVIIRKNDAKGDQDGGSPRYERRERKKPDFFKPASTLGEEDGEDEAFALNEYSIRDLDMKDPDVMSFSTKDGSGAYTVYVSPKLQGVVHNITTLPPGKHFVYSSDKNTIGVLAKLLTLKGITVLLPYKQVGKTKEWTYKEQKQNQAGKSHFIMLDNIVSKKSHVEGIAYMNGNVTATGKDLGVRIETVKRRANEAKNNDGSDIKVILATADHFKGVDINHLKYLHLVDAMADYQDFIQFVGRGSRYCSHRLWRSMVSRKVHVLMYHLMPDRHDDALNVFYADPSLWAFSKSVYNIEWGTMEKSLQEASVDYLVFKDTIHANTKQIQESLMHALCTPLVIERKQPKTKRENKQKRSIPHMLHGKQRCE